MAMELLRRGHEVYVGVLCKKEIDFVAIRQGEKLYIQVASITSEERAFGREVSALLAIKDAFPKMLIARTYQPEYRHEGIRIVDAAEWLSNPIPKKSIFAVLGNGRRASTASGSFAARSCATIRPRR